MRPFHKPNGAGLISASARRLPEAILVQAHLGWRRLLWHGLLVLLLLYLLHRLHAHDAVQVQAHPDLDLRLGVALGRLGWRADLEGAYGVVEALWYGRVVCVPRCERERALPACPAAAIAGPDITTSRS